MVNKQLMMVGGWTGIYEKAKAAGFDITVAQDKADVKPADFALIDRLITSPKNDAVLVDVAAALHGVRPFDAVVSFQEQGLMTAALIGKRLGIDANPLDPVLLTRDKGQMRAHMQRVGIASIPYTVARSADDVVVFGRDHGWPIILKPVGGSGSQQIHKLYGADEVAPAFAQIQTHYPGMQPIAERFMVGPEVSVEAISWNGEHTVLGVTDKITTGAPHFVETGHNMPSALSDATQDAIKSLTARFLSSIGHVLGPSHTEIIVTAEGPVIVESHTRAGGDRIFDMVEQVYGVDMFGLTLAGLSGQFPGVAPSKPRGAAIRYIALPPGTVLSIAGREAAAASEGVIEFELQLEVGRQITPFTHSYERYGFVLTVGDSLEAAIRNADLALSKLHVDIAK